MSTLSKELREGLDALALYTNAKRFWPTELERRDAISQAYEDSLDAANSYCLYMSANASPFWSDR